MKSANLAFALLTKPKSKCFLHFKEKLQPA